MEIFDKSTINEALKLEDGEEFIFEYVDSGKVYQDKAIKVGGEIYYKTESVYTDCKTGKALDCYCHFVGDNMLVAVKCLDGSVELH